MVYTGNWIPKTLATLLEGNPAQENPQADCPALNLLHSLLSDLLQWLGAQLRNIQVCYELLSGQSSPILDLLRILHPD